MSALGPHPDPPGDLDKRAPALKDTVQPWLRIFTLENDPLFFDRTMRNRFDCPEGRYGVLYAAEDAHCAFIETFGYHTGINTITSEALDRRGLAEISASRPLRLIDLVSPGALPRIGADARLFAGEHSIAQRWSQAFVNHPENPDGIYYPARHDPARSACALFDRVSGVLEARSLGSFSAKRNEKLLGRILDDFDYSLIRC